jgi:hypothetical protein
MGNNYNGNKKSQHRQLLSSAIYILTAPSANQEHAQLREQF